MRTFKDMQDRLTDELMVATSSTLFTTDRIKKLIQDAHLWATSLFSWPELEESKYKDSVIAQERYTYPLGFRTDSLGEFLYFNGNRYRRKAFRDYQEHQRINPSSKVRIYADYGRQFFIFPVPMVEAEITVFGQVQATQLVNNTDTTIFTDGDASGNEAIVKKALSVATKRIDKNLSRSEEQGAVAQLTIIWDKILKRQQTEQRMDKPMFNIPNFFPEANSFRLGNFFAGDEE